MAPQVGQQPSARDWIPLLICKNFVELRGFEPLTPSMPWRCATSCATAPRGLGTDEPGPEEPDIGEPHQHRGVILPCHGDDFDLTAEHLVFRPAHALHLVILGRLDAQARPAIRDIGDRGILRSGWGMLVPVLRDLENSGALLPQIIDQQWPALEGQDGACDLWRRPLGRWHG